MAQIKSRGFTRPMLQHVDGRAAVLLDKFTLAANPTAADTLDAKIPAGFEIAEVKIQMDDLDTNGSPTIVFGVGYAPVNAASTLTPNATYFAPVGRTTGQTGGRLECAFKPIKFEEDVYLRITIGTASATFAAGDVDTIVVGNCVGPK